MRLIAATLPTPIPLTRMALIVQRFRWISWWAAAALLFQALALAAQTPMEIERAFAAPPCHASDCSSDHHGGPARTGDDCQICLGMQVAGQAVAPAAPVLPLPPLPLPTEVFAAAFGLPRLDAARPQNPRAPPTPV